MTQNNGDGFPASGQNSPDDNANLIGQLGWLNGPIGKQFEGRENQLENYLINRIRMR